jgi:hypothetical protein
MPPIIFIFIRDYPYKIEYGATKWLYSRWLVEPCRGPQRRGHGGVAPGGGWRGELHAHTGEGGGQVRGQTMSRSPRTSESLVRVLRCYLENLVWGLYGLWRLCRLERSRCSGRSDRGQTWRGRRTAACRWGRPAGSGLSEAHTEWNLQGWPKI